MKQLLIVALLSAVAACAQTPETHYTLAMRNGRGWADLSATAKLWFVVGFAEALQQTPPEKRLIYLSSATFAETVLGVNQFYEDPANGAVPVAYALATFREKVNGAKPEELATSMADLRRIFNGTADPVAAKAPPAK